MNDTLLEDHRVWFVVDVVVPFGFLEPACQYAGRGHKAHHPAVLAGLPGACRIRVIVASAVGRVRRFALLQGA
ncbi:hypothetical protein [Thioalkalivibrio sp. ALJT]|uniref:hypothetical protein n=1 Tax=Thioalkalivibrio sp. ALJT TaxID=1158146 RepID=UPI0003829F5E|nr:hypothetical protein [Thioalkalivibrio sp. ALJT]